MKKDLGHIWKWNGDVKQCKKCKTYMGVWDGKKPCKPLTSEVKSA